jgi:hypothetical protein
MDLLPLGKKCIFIPTPGQPEQEYLAGYLAAKGWCCTASQKSFSLGPLVKQAGNLQIPDLSSFNNPDLIRRLVAELTTYSPALG